MNSLHSYDELTGLFDRQYVLERLPQEMALCQQGGLPLSIIIADIDYFRQINENCSHTAGDLALKHFGELLRTESLANKGWAARFGGEEFLICLPGTGLDTALHIAEKVRQQLEESTIIYREIEIRLTASFGLARLAGPEYTVEHILAEAELKLAEAKESGRNQVRC